MKKAYLFFPLTSLPKFYLGQYATADDVTVAKQLATMLLHGHQRIIDNCTAQQMVQYERVQQQMLQNLQTRYFSLKHGRKAETQEALRLIVCLYTDVQLLVLNPATSDTAIQNSIVPDVPETEEKHSWNIVNPPPLSPELPPLSPEDEFEISSWLL